jgi:hypothetical protein
VVEYLKVLDHVGFFCFACRGIQRRGLREVSDHRKGKFMSLGLILLIVLILMLLGAFPRWGYSRDWGYGPSGGLGLVLVVVLILVVLGRV